MLRKLVKYAAFGVALVCVSPLVLAARLEALVAPASERVFGAAKEILSLVPTVVGSYLRTAYYWAVCTSVAMDAHFLLGSMVAHRNVRIGRRTIIGPYSIIGYADIGDDVLIGARVSVLSGKYQHGRPGARRDGALRHPLQFSRVQIGHECWIGESSVVMANLGPRATVGAGSVVTRDFGEGVTILGNPARRVNLGEIGEPSRLVEPVL